MGRREHGVRRRRAAVRGGWHCGERRPRSGVRHALIESKGREPAANPRIALVAGGLDGGDRTVQSEGVADFPAGDALEDMQRTYYAAFPDGRDRLRWPGLVYVRVTPRWIRFSDFSVQPPAIVELFVGDEP